MRWQGKANEYQVVAISCSVKLKGTLNIKVISYMLLNDQF